MWIDTRQECIPVGCVSHAHWPYCLVLCFPGERGVVDQIWPGGGWWVTRSDQGVMTPPSPHQTRHLPPSDHVTYPMMHLMSPPPPPLDRVSDTRMWKHNIRSLRYEGGKNEFIRNLVSLTWLQNDPNIDVFRIRFGLVLFTCKQNKLTNKNKSKVERQRLYRN